MKRWFSILVIFFFFVAMVYNPNSFVAWLKEPENYSVNQDDESFKPKKK